MKKENVIKYCKNFMGYGDLNSDTLIVGMEEGDKAIYHTQERVTRRIDTVVDLLEKGNGQTIDFLEAHKIHSPEQYEKIINNKLFSPYWRIATRVIMNAKKLNVDDNTAIAKFFKEYIIKHLSILEFRALPCTDLKTWNYNEWTDVKELKDRKSYYEWNDTHRINNLRNIINNSNFKQVLIFGKSLEKQWSSILGVDFSEASVYKYEKASIKVLDHEGINYFLIPQNSKVTSNKFFDWVGSKINTK